MFGYVTPKICELKVREHDLYRAYYCGLCKVLQKEYHKSSVLNYDCVFIYLLADSLNQEKTDIQPCRCALHPVKGKSKVVSGSAEYAAAVNVLMAYAKLKDDIADQGHVGARMQLPFYQKAYHRAAKKAPVLAERMLQTANKLHGIEKAGSADTDEAADTYAQLLGHTLEDLDVLQSHVLYDLGYSLGRWVYLIDAFDDLEKDIKSGDYNVFARKYGGCALTDTEVRKEIVMRLGYTLSCAADALRRLQLKKNRGILENIVCLGLRERTRNVLQRGMNGSI